MRLPVTLVCSVGLLAVGGLVVVGGPVGCLGRSALDKPPVDRRGVGDRCVPSVENGTTYSGAGVNEIQVEEGHPQCRNEFICLVNHFQGRVSCPEGQATNEGSCLTAQDADPVTPKVCGQCSERPASAAVYCTCKCGPPEGEDDDDEEDYCPCPADFDCVDVLGTSHGHELAGSYCIKSGTEYDTSSECGTVTGYWDSSCAGSPSN